jgi:hypothetical protein
MISRKQDKSSACEAQFLFGEKPRNFLDQNAAMGRAIDVQANFESIKI